MRLETEPYADQVRRWPQDGRHILAHYNASDIVVYQAYAASTRDFSVANGKLGGPQFSFNRMSWIKPNFLWMMYRAGWARKPGQETVLGLRIGRRFFETILERAVPSSFDADLFEDHADWQRALAASEVRLQWDPDHAPSGAAVERRAIQLGLRGETLRAFATAEMLEVIDMTPFVREQAALAASPALRTPAERPFVPDSEAARRRIGLDRT